MIKSFLSNTVLTVLTVDLLALTTDTTMSWTSPSLPKLTSNDTSVNPFGTPITEDEVSWIGSLVSVGAIIGPLPCSFLADKIGRKYSLLLISIPFIISYVLLALVQNITCYYIARLLAGIGGGAGCTLLPMYIAEIAEDSNRGTLSVSLNVFWCFGSLIPYILGPYTSILVFNFFLASLPVVFFVLFLLVAPETPYFLIRNNRRNEAEAALMKLRSKSRDEVAKELNHIQNVLDQEEKASFFDLFKSRSNLKAVGISLTIIFLQQACGINVVMFYTQFIFDMSAGPGGSTLPSEVSSLIVGFVFFLSSFIITFIADRLGRKVLMILSSGGVAVSMALFGGYFYVKNSTGFDVETISWVPISCLVLFMVTFNLGLGALPWTISSELFSMNIRSVGASLVAFFCSFTSFLMTRFFSSLNNSLGEAWTFWIFAASGLGCCFFTYFFVPETRGKSFKEIQENLQK